jgi:hypothetical protein
MEFRFPQAWNINSRVVMDMDSRRAGPPENFQKRRLGSAERRLLIKQAQGHQITWKRMPVKPPDYRASRLPACRRYVR